MSELRTGENSQVVLKACAVLREISRKGAGGARLTDITSHTGFSRPSVLRILGALKSEGFVQQTDDRRYSLSALFHEIGMSAPSPVKHVETLRPLIQGLADHCGDTVYLAIRNGEYAYYLLRCQGAYPIRTYVVNPYQTLHIVSCHSGRALLAALPEQEAEEIISRVWSESKDLFHATTADALREEIEFIRENGFGWARDVTFEGVAGLTMAIPNPNGPSYMAVTISSISQRLTLDRARELLPRLKKTAKDIRRMIDDSA